jgi:F-type H+-transporting ATPase subunit b
MLIDWFTVSAQVINFLILVWLMKRFLYQPILNAIDAREQLISKSLSDANDKKNDAKKEQDAFTHKNALFNQERATLLSQAKAEAKAARQILLDEARQEADALGVKQQASIRLETDNLHQSISHLAKEAVFSIVRKTLSDLASVSLEARVVELFTNRLREMDDQAKKTLGEALRNMPDAAMIKSAFDLPEAQRVAIQNALNETFSAEISIEFETRPDLISGIELIANGKHLVWSIDGYLDSLENNLTALLSDQRKPKANTDTQVKDHSNTKSSATKSEINQP